MISEERITVEEDGWTCTLTRCELCYEPSIAQWVTSPEGMRFHSHADPDACPFTEEHARELLHVTQQLLGFMGGGEE